MLSTELNSINCSLFVICHGECAIVALGEQAFVYLALTEESVGGPQGVTIRWWHERRYLCAQR